MILKLYSLLIKFELTDFSHLNRQKLFYQQRIYVGKTFKSFSLPRTSGISIAIITSGSSLTSTQMESA